LKNKKKIEKLCGKTPQQYTVFSRKKITKQNFKPAQYLKSKINKNNFEKKRKINAKQKRKKGKVGEKYKRKRKSKKKKEECTVDYCCNPQCIWVWGNSDFPTPFSCMYNNLVISSLRITHTTVT
jgi:hypothetical protein